MTERKEKTKKTPEQIEADRAVYLALRAYQNSALTSRAQVAQRLNTQFGGKRDMAEALGYPNDPGYADLYNLYQRDGMAARIVDCVSDETWRKAPVILDGALRSDLPADVGKSKFLKDFDDLVKDHDLWTLFSDADAICGYSRFAAILLGLPGNMSAPAKKGKIKYLNALDEGQIEVVDVDSDSKSPRFGQPVMYRLKPASNGEQGTSQTSQLVHWSRVIHIREGRGRSPIYGKPRLYRLIDRLYDLAKVVGGGSEAFWLAVFRGMAFLAREGSDLPRADTPEFEQMQDDIEEYIHGLNRYMQLQGVDVQDLGGSAVDGNGQFQVIVACLAGIASIPKRILIGSELGQLASTQDDKNFADTIAGRQTRFAEVRILRAFIDRLISLGIISAPQAPRYAVKWLSLFELNPVEKSTQAVNVANALSTMTGGVPDDAMTVSDFTQTYLDYELPAAPEIQNDQVDQTTAEPSPDQPGESGQQTASDQSAPAGA